MVSQQELDEGYRELTESHISEAGTIGPVASDVQAQGKHILEVTLLRGGVSKNGNEYGADVLRQAAPMFEGVQAFADHGRDPARPERSVRDIVGYYRDARYTEGGNDPRITAALHLIPGTDWLWNVLQETQHHPELCGLSIDAYARTSEGKGGRRVVESIHKVNSVDVVTRPSAGGSVDRILQSERERPMEAHAAQNVPNQERRSPAGDASDIQAILELHRNELRQLQEERQKAEAEITQLREVAAAEAKLTNTLQEAKLPEIVSAKLHKRFRGRTFQDQELTEAIDDQKEVLASLSSAGQVTGMGSPEKGLTVGLSEYDRVQAAFDGMFDLYESDAARSVPRLTGIREAFHVATGVDIGSTGGADRPIKESIADGLRAHVRAGHLQEAEVLLREADVTTASFSYLLGTSMNKRLLKDYQAWPSEWQKFTNVVSIKDFKQQDRVRLGAFGSLSTVAEDAAYTTLTVSDTRAIYTPTKRGNIVQVTRETIVNDDLYSIKQIPQKLAVAAAFTLAEFVYQTLVTPNGAVIYDGNKLYDSVNHKNSAVVAANLGTANSGGALNSANLQAAVIAMRKQQNLASKPIGLKPRYLLTVPDLEFTAMTLLKSAGLPGGNNNDINPMMGYCEPIIAPQMNSGLPASTTAWVAIADPRVIDTVEVGFVGGQVNPVLLIQDMPLYGLNFTQDVISYKVRHEYGGAVVDYRGFYLGNN